MRALKYLIAIWIGVAIYSLSSFFTGAMGISAYRGLEIERDKQRANLESLRRINQELKGAMDALRYDSDTILVYARELGYGLKDERFIRIVGLGGGKKQRVLPGRVIASLKPDSVPDKTLRLIAACAALGVLLCLGLTGFLRRPRR
ncbi:MAG: septum formation initiator family protein [Spirochaetaceae bacterium]|jgi:cell division protein FtsB|nr:septum formation initiator family protein [Spirochaetaceae bacterium]